MKNRRHHRPRYEMVSPPELIAGDIITVSERLPGRFRSPQLIPPAVRYLIASEAWLRNNWAAISREPDSPWRGYGVEAFVGLAKRGKLVIGGHLIVGQPDYRKYILEKARILIHINHA